MGISRRSSFLYTLVIILSLLLTCFELAPQAFRKDHSHTQWHHRAFHDELDSVRSDVRLMLHSRTEVPFQVLPEVNVVLVGFNKDGGYKYSIDAHQLEKFLKMSSPWHRPSCLETGELSTLSITWCTMCFR